MYDFRNLSAEQRLEAIRSRRERGFPLHEPPHLEGVAGEFLITAACFEHRHIFETPEDLTWLTEQVLQGLSAGGYLRRAFVVLPNHYHLLIQIRDLSAFSEAIRRVHSRVATEVNGRQMKRGRRVWYRFSDRAIRSERHLWAAVNYVHRNPVKHGFVEEEEAWPWSSVHEYLTDRGRDWLQSIRQAYPLGEFGKGWDR
jgi:putative transposase